MNLVSFTYVTSQLTIAVIFDDLHAEFTTLKGVFSQKRSLLKTKIKYFQNFYLLP